MRRSVVVVLCVTFVAIAVDAGRTKRKSLEAPKHGVARSPHHGRLRGHKTVDESPHSVYKDEWLKMTKYTKTKNSDCKKKCGKHQICLVDSTTGQTECFSRHNFREGRRLFRKFRNHDTNGLKKTIENYSKHHQKHGEKHHNRNNIDHMDHQKSSTHPGHKHPDHQKKDNSHHKNHLGNHPHHNHHKKHSPHQEKKEHPHKQEHPQHKKEHPHPKNVHPQIKNEHSQHKNVHPQHKNVQAHEKNAHLHEKNAHPHEKNAHPQHKNEHHQKKEHHNKHQQKGEITNNHSGPHKKEVKMEELHAELTPSVVHGHVTGISEQEAQKVADARVALEKAKAEKVIRKLAGKTHHKGGHGKVHHKKGPHKGHKGKGRKHHGKHSKGPKLPKHHVCSKADLDIMSSRLTGWFALLHARSEEKLHLKLPIHKHIHKCDCQETAVWAFHQFDHNRDLHLNHSELLHLETNQNEPCLVPFINSCDHNLDSLLTRKEWCCCFAKTQPPCLQRKQSLREHNLLGAFTPRCDEAGYYQKEQCHSSTGYCWCVDLNGNEIPKTRALRRANCDKLSVMGYEMKN